MIPPLEGPAVEPPTVTDKGITMRWRDLGKNVRYHFQVAKDKEFKTIFIDETLDTPEASIEKPQAVGRYYVRTSAIDSEGSEGSFSPPQSFEVKGSPLYYILFWLTVGAIVVL